MATILKPSEREFKENPNRMDHFRLFTDISRARKGIDPEHLNFDIRRLDPGQYSSTYHSHRYAEELFIIMSGSATLRTPEGLETVESGDIIFMEKGDTGAHQMYNHTQEPCVYLDIRTFNGFDVVDYPDSGKLLLAPSREMLVKDPAASKLYGEEGVNEKWEELRRAEKK